MNGVVGIIIVRQKDFYCIAKTHYEADGFFFVEKRWETVDLWGGGYHIYIYICIPHNLEPQTLNKPCWPLREYKALAEHRVLCHRAPSLMYAHSFPGFRGVRFRV